MLLVYPKPKPDESLSMYLLRVAEVNGYQRPGGLFTLAGVQSGPATLHKVLTETAYLSALARVIGRPEGEMLNLVYTPENGVKLPSYAEYQHRKVPLLALRREHVCVCPACLREDNYGRQEWDWSLFATCARHGSLLLDRCPSCGESISRYREGVSKCLCGFDFSTAQTAPGNLDTVNFIESLFNGTQTFGDPDTAIHSVVHLAALGALHEQLEPNLSQFWRTPIDTLQQALTDACAVMRDNGFEDFVRKVGQRRLERWPELGPRGALLPFLIYREHLGEFWDAAAIDRVGKELCRPSHGVTKFAADETMGLESVAVLLGVSTRVAVDSIRHKALVPVRGPAVDGFGSWIFSTHDVAELLGVLSSCQEPDDSPCYDWEEILMPPKPGIKGWGHLLGMLRAGVLRVVAFDPSRGLPSLRIQGLSLHKAKDRVHLSVAECAKRIGIYADAVYRVIKAGILPALRRGRTYEVMPAAFQKFNESYVFVKELVRELRVNPTNLAEKLMGAGVLPISGPRVDNGLVYLFRREEIARIDLKAVARKERYKTLTGRKSTLRQKRSPTALYIRSGEAAEMLGLTIQQLAAVVRAGALKERQVKEKLVNTKLFLLVDIEKYLAEFRNNPKLVSLEEAAEILGEKPEYFHRKWVRTGKLEAVSDGLNQFYRREQVEALHQEKQRLLTAREASAMVGGDRFTIANWTKMGRLRPVAGPKIDGSKWYLYAREDVERLVVSGYGRI